MPRVLILLASLPSIRHDCCLDSGRLHDAEHSGSYCCINARSAEADAPGLALVDPGAMACVPRDVVLLPSVVHGELRCAASTAQQSCKQRLSLTDSG